MAVNLKLGQQAFAKEKRIAQLEEQVRELEKSNEHFIGENGLLVKKVKEQEKTLFELKSSLSLHELEQERQRLLARQQSESQEKTSQSLVSTERMNDELKLRVKELLQEVEELRNEKEQLDIECHKFVSAVADLSLLNRNTSWK